ncbi:MAG: FAD-binding oxidoreductase [Anaerolineales bacterium]|nr:FAD-binding oxidoreductase [Anaerolineales bacterium]
MKNQYDVILVGGGVMGCATAYYLLKADRSLKVAIIEKDGTYARSSTTLSDGNIRVQFNVKQNILISQYGLEMLARFAEDMAVGDDLPDIAFRQQGDLFIFDENGRYAAEQGLKLQNSLGCGIELLTPAEIENRYPLLNMENCAGGTFGRQEGTMDPHAVLQGFKNKAIALGAKFIEAEVAQVLVTTTAVAGIRLAAGDILHAKIVVNCAGAWVPQLASKIGIELPIEPVKRQVFVLETAVTPPTPLPLTVFPSGLYIIQEHGSHFLCAKSMQNDPVGFDDFSWHQQKFMDDIWPELVEYVPAFDRLKVVSGWAGLYAVNTFDGNAILGEWPGLSGLYLIGGFSGHGFQQCFAVGRYISELILDNTPTLDLSIFSPQRILDNSPVYENQHKLV